MNWEFLARQRPNNYWRFGDFCPGLVKLWLWSAILEVFHHDYHFKLQNRSIISTTNRYKPTSSCFNHRHVLTLDKKLQSSKFSLLRWCNSLNSLFKFKRSFFVWKLSFLVKTYFEAFFLHEVSIMGLRILIIELDFNRRLSEWGQEGNIRVMAHFPWPADMTGWIRNEYDRLLHNLT